MALINAASLIWASYLDHRLRSRPVPKHYEVHVEGTKVFSEVDLAEVEKRAVAQLDHAVQQAAVVVQQAVADNVQHITQTLNETTMQSLSNEFEKYQVSLQALRDQTIAQFTNVQKEIEEKRAQMLEQLDREVEVTRKERMEHFNDRINDVVASYLAESLGSQVDLGTQTAFILQNLQKHKEDIKRDVMA